MADYAISVARSAEKEIANLPGKVLARVKEVIDALSSKPRPIGCKKLAQSRNRWRLRVGDYRVIYTIDDRSRRVDIERVRHRRFAYR
jgi:mRNA interferase RelE/StbE